MPTAPSAGGSLLQAADNWHAVQTGALQARIKHFWSEVGNPKFPSVPWNLLKKANGSSDATEIFSVVCIKSS